MFHENLKRVRKAKGLSQEELAIRLNVVRQTISKWEKGLSVPDADMLMKLADVFETPVSELLGAQAPNDAADTNQVAAQLARINEQLAVKNRRAKLIWKAVIGIILAAVFLHVLMVILATVSFNRFQADKLAEVTVQTEAISSGE